jgi:hypothetical protein
MTNWKFATSPVLCLLLSAGVTSHKEASAANVVLFNTGVSTTGTQLAAGASDSHWKVVAGPGITTPINAVVVTTQSPLGSYFGTADSRWIWTDAASGYGVNLNSPFTFRLQFDLTGFDPATTVITGAWGVDDLGSIRVNGVAPVGTGAFSITGFNTPRTFVINGGFVSGLNTLDVLATNTGAWGAFNMTALTGTASLVPELRTYEAMVIGLLAFGLLFRQKYRF